MDQYRVTREVPLPYSFDVLSNDEEEEHEEEEEVQQQQQQQQHHHTRSYLKKRMGRPRRNGGHG